tara:strand:- start:498 stop:656 length:159 start_codon:yes stop_codon:yes gene_type:complete
MKDFDEEKVLPFEIPYFEMYAEYKVYKAEAKAGGYEGGSYEDWLLWPSSWRK